MKDKISVKYRNTANCFVKNILRVMRVAGGGGESPEAMTQQELSKRAGVARSTLANHKDLWNKEEKAPNPTLGKICAIADALNVPPAFLLMRSEDWRVLAQAVEFYTNMRGEKFKGGVFEQVVSGGNVAPVKQAEIALKFAKMIAVVDCPGPDVLELFSEKERDGVLEKVRRQRASIFASSVLPSVANMNQGERAAAFVVSVVFGASYRQE